MYSISRIEGLGDIDGELAEWLLDSAEHLSFMYGHKFDFTTFNFAEYGRNGLFLICRKNGKPTAALLARLINSVFDPKVKILLQDELYVRRPGGREAYLLMQEFIDFGRRNANHLISMIASQTNIKGRSLEKLGFEKLETLYRLEV